MKKFYFKIIYIDCKKKVLVSDAEALKNGCRSD